MRRVLIVSVLLVAACGHDGTPGPTSPTPAAAAFGVSGTVLNTANRPLAQARVEAVDGPQQGAFAFTDDAGAFVFPAIFTSRVTLRASRDGYRDQSSLISSAQSNLSFRLDSASNPFDSKGTYEVRFEADPACKDLPADVRTRTYSASFSQTGGTFYLGALTGADFGRGGTTSYPIWNVLYISVADDSAHVYLSDPPIWEHLTTDADLVIVGDAQGLVRADTSRLALGGNFIYCPRREAGEDYPECEVPEASCWSQTHLLTITRK